MPRSRSRLVTAVVTLTSLVAVLVLSFSHFLGQAHAQTTHAQQSVLGPIHYMPTKGACHKCGANLFYHGGYVQTAVIRESNVIASGETNGPALPLVLPQGKKA